MEREREIDVEAVEGEDEKEDLPWLRIDQTWENVEEDLKNVSQNKDRLLKRRLHQDSRIVRRGMQRHLFIIIDCSKGMSANDMKPTRIRLLLKVLEAFIKEFFDQNPLSQMAVIVSHSSIAEKLTELNGNPLRHISILKDVSQYLNGELSLQNSLELARSSLRHVPKYGSREILVIMGSFTSVDPGDIHVTVANLKKDAVRCSVVGMGAEVFLCKKLTQETNGSYFVALNEEHFHELIFQHTPPSASASKAEASLVQMGFPQRRTDTIPSLCACHKQFKLGGYVCPRCQCKYCELPVDCLVCGLTLVSSPHLARSYHHLFPVPVFLESPPAETEANCFACQLYQPEKSVWFSCPRCKRMFCLECDIFIHESLHNCPGCELNST